MRIVQAVVAVAPPVLILWMGGTYLRDCGELLLAPGVPIGFDYKSPDGPIRFFAQGYRIDPGQRTVASWGLSARRENGALLASVESVDASGLDPFSPHPDVRVRGVRAHLERDKNGLDLARLLPKREGPPSTIPYAVTLLDARIDYVDRTFGKPLVQTLQTSRLVLDGVGDDWRSEGRIRLPGVGEADTRAQSIANIGVTLDLRSEALRLGRFVPILAPGVSVGSLVARGPVRIDLPTAGKARIAAVLRADAQNVRYKGYAADAVLFDGKATPDGAQGTIIARTGDVRVRFQGTATTREGGGNVVASVPSPASLPAWVRRYLPTKTGFRNAGYEGWVAWKGVVPRLVGTVRAAGATYGADVVENVRARVAYSPERIDVRGLTAVWNGSPLAGDLSYDSMTRAIQGAAAAPRVELARLARRLGRPDLGVGGTVEGEALVSGTLAKPQIEGSLTGRVTLKGRALGDVEARGAWLDGAARVDRLRVSGPLGAIVAGGTVRPDGTLDLNAEVRGLRIERLVPSARGLVSADLQVGGTLRDPKATGRLEAYRLAYGGQTLPAAGVDLTADRQRIELRRLAAVRGTARLRGRVGVSLAGKGVVLAEPKTWLLDGRLALTGVQANEIPGADAVGDLAGLLSIPRVDLSGRLGDPRLVAGLQGDGIIVRGVRLDSLRGTAQVDRRGARLSDFEVKGGGGTIKGAGSYDLRTKGGDIDLSLADVQLSKLLADVSEDVIVTGTVSAPKVHLAIRDGKPVGQAEGTLEEVKVNDVLAGDGNWSLDATGDRIKAEASVGRLDPTLRALDASAIYNVKAGSLAATVQAKDVPIQTVVAAIEAKRTSSQSEAERLSTVAGDLSGTVEAVRTREGDLKIDATDLRAAAIRYVDLDYGTLTLASLTRRAGRWTLVGGKLDGPEGRFALDGWVQEDRNLDLQASGEAVKVAAFSPFAPTLAEITGTARFALLATGDVDHPIVTGSAGVEGVDAGKGEALALSLERIDVRDGKSSLGGTLRYGDRFGGLFTATTGWMYRSDLKAAAVMAKLDFGALVALDPLDPSKGLSVAPVSLADVPGLGAYIDPKRTIGATLTGSFAASGSYNAPKLSGGVALRASQLGITVPGDPGRPVTQADDVLRNVKADLGFDERNAPRLDLSADFERGGVLTAMATLGDLGGKPVFQVLNEQRDWKALPVTGFVDMDAKNRVTLKQNVAGGTTQATVEGRLDFAGFAAAPEVKGAFEVSNFSTDLPSLGEGGGGSATALIDPSFNIKINLAKDGKPQPGKFHTATADLYLTGGARIKGSLSALDAKADFVTDHGSIRLPGGVVRVDRGGQIDFAYQPALAAGQPATADISIQGHSQLTVARQGLGTQRYDITLDINGDLLREGGIKFEASSDPSDLSQAEILNALGGTQYLQGISEGGSSTERNLRYAFAGFALPGLLDPVTSGIGRAFGLDYLGLEYNQYDLATVAFVRNLPYGFSFQGRGQVGTPPPGVKPIYDVRLSYRLPSKKLSRLSLAVGTDQDRPYKGSIEYGTRFGTTGSRSGTKHSLFPKKTP